mmetsp:Transcript_17854/g.30378  ORF Transcript_17854/g.30378 Transcript_17854/m.30378 type:complete len:81 (+) Transcript_17854:1308-1550(+)
MRTTKRLEELIQKPVGKFDSSNFGNFQVVGVWLWQERRSDDIRNTVKEKGQTTSPGATSHVVRVMCGELTHVHVCVCVCV